MEKLATTIVLILSCLAFSILSYAQDIRGFSYRLIDDDKLEVSYTLIGNEKDLFEVLLYSSHNNFIEPVTLVTGDVGINITPGQDKKIVWDAKAELGDFEGNLAVKLQAKFIPFVTFNIAKGDKFRRGKEYAISWDSSGDKMVNFELFMGNKKVSDIGTTNKKTFTWNIPKRLRTDKNYIIKASGKERVSFSEPFRIKRKVPVLLWALPVALTGTAIMVLLNTSNDDDGPIPLPIKPR